MPILGKVALLLMGSGFALFLVLSVVSAVMIFVNAEHWIGKVFAVAAGLLMSGLLVLLIACGASMW